MRSYEAARSSFNFMEGLSWLIIICGGIAAVLGLVASSSSGGALMVAAVLPGLALAAVGSFGLSYAQTSRASVDCAEYAQQSLKLARDQFEISKQLLKLAQGDTSSATYQFEADDGPLQDISFDTDDPSAQGGLMHSELGQQSSTQALQIHQYNQVQITKTPEGYQIGDDLFATLEAAKSVVDKPESRAFMAINSDQN